MRPIDHKRVDIEERMPLDVGDFVSEPVGDKCVTKILGITSKHAETLKGAGLTEASQLVGKFLRLRKKKEAFRSWLTSILSFDDDGDLDGVCEAVSKYTDTYVGQRY